MSKASHTRCANYFHGGTCASWVLGLLAGVLGSLRSHLLMPISFQSQQQPAQASNVACGQGAAKRCPQGGARPCLVLEQPTGQALTDTKQVLRRDRGAQLPVTDLQQQRRADAITRSVHDLKGRRRCSLHAATSPCIGCGLGRCAMNQ